MREFFSRIFVLGFLLAYLGLFLGILFWGLGRRLRRSRKGDRAIGRSGEQMIGRSVHRSIG
jgi:hypothetical protein